MSDWWDGFFEDAGWLYIQRTLWSDAVTDAQVTAIQRWLALEPGMRLLDAPCGTARHASRLARAGIDVVGVDISESLLADARKACDGLDVELRLGDMRDIEGDESFDGAINMWGSFGFFDDQGNAEFAANVCRALKPGGRFLIDTHTSETLFSRYTPTSYVKVGDARLLEDRRYDDRNGRMEVDWTIVRDGREFSLHTSIRIYSMPELRALLHEAGFTQIVVYSELDGTLFNFPTHARRAYVVATR